MAATLSSVLTPEARALASQLATSLPPPGWRTRFAPAPTGFLHLGHVVNALHVWGIARAHGGAVVLRVEDHDRSRCRAAYEQELLDDLEWLGFVPDVGSINAFRAGRTYLRQSDNLARYEAVLAELTAQGFVYACTCTRTDIARVAGAAAGEETRYPGTCAHAAIPLDATAARRVRVLPGIEHFNDVRLGSQHQQPSLQCGDFLLRDRQAQITYQFAVTVDDFDQGIAVVIRGEDLLASTGRQLQLARLVGRSEPARFFHHALILRADGSKLSKSLGDSGVRELRDAGLSASSVLGRAAFYAGLLVREVPIEPRDIALLFAS